MDTLAVGGRAWLTDVDADGERDLLVLEHGRLSARQGNEPLWEVAVEGSCEIGPVPNGGDTGVRGGPGTACGGYDGRQRTLPPMEEDLSAAAGDLNLDGRVEVVTVSRSGNVQCLPWSRAEMGAEGTDPAAGLPDIRTDADVHRVERFYEKAPADPRSGTSSPAWTCPPMFRASRRSGNGSCSAQVTTGRTHERAPPPACTAAMEAEHFERWLALWSATVREHFQGTKADEAIDRAGSIARVMMHHVLGRLPLGLPQVDPLAFLQDGVGRQVVVLHQAVQLHPRTGGPPQSDSPCLATCTEVLFDLLRLGWMYTC